MLQTFDVPILIVAYRNPEDVIGCLKALARTVIQPSFQVCVVENGGTDAFEALTSALASAESPCKRDMQSEDLPVAPQLKRVQTFRLVRQDGSEREKVRVAEAIENLGYAGGVNSWLRPLLAMPGWKGAWILNPDTEPEPNALRELVRHAALRRTDLTGSRLVLASEPERIQSRGLAWQKLRGGTLAIDWHAPASQEPDIDDVERRLDSPSGASLYATREAIERIGLMDERYFLYFEDLEWGCRAKRGGRIGYAHNSIVVHKGGTTIGSAARRKDRSTLSVYLSFRNAILFVRDYYPSWLLWTVIMQLADIGVFILKGSFSNVTAALRGLGAGLAGKVGRPGK